MDDKICETTNRSSADLKKSVFNGRLCSKTPSDRIEEQKRPYVLKYIEMEKGNSEENSGGDTDILLLCPCLNWYNIKNVFARLGHMFLFEFNETDKELPGTLLVD